MKLLTRKGCLRIAILGVVLLLGLVLCWWVMIRMPGKSFAGPLPPPTAQEKDWAEKLRQHIVALAGQIGERNIFSLGTLEQAAKYIEGAFANANLSAKRQTFEVTKVRCDNLEVEIPGTARRDELVVIGAHYDSVPGSPGANDNGSGVASLLVLAEAFARTQPGRTLRFVAFVNEEPPNFQTDSMGSRVYARRCRERREKIVAMISLETMGYFSDQEGSQKYPPPLGMIYPRRGNFIAFVGNVSSGKLVRKCIEIFRRDTPFPSEGASLPGAITGVGWSDHWSFWEEGYPAIMITDTAPFRYPYYHSIEDTPDKINFPHVARVTAGIQKIVHELANPK
jgi:hypothetical protein